MTAAAPDNIRELLRVSSNTQLLVCKNFGSQMHQFLHPVPKAEPGDYRPLRLVEVVAKAQRRWMISAVLSGCNAVWEKHKLLHPNNFGFHPGISIDTALRIKTKHHRGCATLP